MGWWEELRERGRQAGASAGESARRTAEQAGGTARTVAGNAKDEARETVHDLVGAVITHPQAHQNMVRGGAILGRRLGPFGPLLGAVAGHLLHRHLTSGAETPQTPSPSASEGQSPQQQPPQQPTRRPLF